MNKKNMARIPDDMLFYYNTTKGTTHYFSVYYSIKKDTTRVVEIEEEDLWALVKDGGLHLIEISPADFVHTIPGNISGTVKAFII